MTNLEKRQLADLLEQRAETMAKADEMAQADDISPETLATIQDLVQKVRNIDSRITALEAKASGDQAEPDNEGTPLPEKVARHLANAKEVRRVLPHSAFFGEKKMDSNATLRSWFKAGTELEQRSDLDQVARSGNNSHTLNLRAGLVTTSAPGSSAVGESMLPDFEKFVREFCPIVDFARVIRTKSGEPLRIAIDADQAGANRLGRWVPETEADQDKQVILEQRTLGAFTCSSNICLLSYEILEDAAIDIGRLVSEALGTRIGRTVAQALIAGSGTGEPSGLQILTDNDAAGSQKIASVETTASGAVAYDDLVAMFGATPPNAVASKNCRWLLNSSTYAALLKLKDDMKRPLLQPGGEAKDSPAGTLLGKPVVIAPELDNIASGKYPIYFGDFSQLAVRQVGDVLVQKSMERYFETRQVAYRALLRLDSCVLDGASFRALKIKA